MTNTQWFGMMWILCMICYYVSDKGWGPLIASFIFLVFAALSFMKDKSDE